MFIAAEEGGEKQVGVDKVLEKGKLEEARTGTAWQVRAILNGSSFLLLVVTMLLVAMPGAPSSVLAPSSKARSP